MELGLTIPLQRALGAPKPPYGTEEDLRLCWDAHVLRQNGEESLLFVHCASRFVLLCGMPPEGEAGLPRAFVAALRAGLRAEGFPAGQVAAYETLAGLPCLTKTHGRRPVAHLNCAVEDWAALPVFGANTARLLNALPRHAPGHTGRDAARVFLGRDLQNLLGG